MYFDSLFLYCQKQIHTNRTTSAIYRLLKGFKAIQTLQDAKLFQVQQFYGVYPSLTQKQYHDKIEQLIKQKLIVNENSSKQIIRLTGNGEAKLHELSHLLHFKLLDGMTYQKIDDLFHQRLLLFIQTLLNTRMNHFNFIPIIDSRSITEWVRTYYHQTIQNHDHIRLKLYEELMQLLRLLPNQWAAIFVDRLTGYQTYGLNTFQLAHKYQLAAEDIPIVEKATIHYMLATINSNIQSYPILSSFMKQEQENIALTISAEKTYSLLKQGYSLEQVARLRRLKKSTIEDHIIEIALNDVTFPYEAYLPEAIMNDIRQAINITRGYKLKDIKEKLRDDISYFQIRLYLAITNE